MRHAWGLVGFKMVQQNVHIGTNMLFKKILKHVIELQIQDLQRFIQFVRQKHIRWIKRFTYTTTTGILVFLANIISKKATGVCPRAHV